MDDDHRNDGPAAGLVTAIAAVPLVLCCLGPLIFGSVVGGLAGTASWLGGLGAAGVAAAALAAGVIAYGLLRRREARLRQVGAPQMRQSSELDRGEAATPDGRRRVGLPG